MAFAGALWIAVLAATLAPVAGSGQVARPPVRPLRGAPASVAPAQTSRPCDPVLPDPSCTPDALRPELDYAAPADAGAAAREGFGPVALLSAAGIVSSLGAMLVAKARAGRRVLSRSPMQVELTPAVFVVEGEKAAAPAEEDAVPWQQLALPFLVPALGGLLFGLDIGATSGAVVNLTDPTLAGTTWFALDSAAKGLLVSGSLAGALGGSVLGANFGDNWGRRTEMTAAAGCYALASVGEALAPGYAPLVAARALYGLGIGLAMHAAPIYIAETAPPSARGALVSLKEAMIVGGILLGYVASSTFIGDVGGWRNMYGLAAIPSLVYLAGALYTPESPRWLLLKASQAPAESAQRAELRDEASAALTRLRGEGQQARVEREVLAAERSLAAAAAASAEEVGWGEILTTKGYLSSLAVGGGLVVWQQITGQPSVLYFATSIFQNAGFSSLEEASKISVGLGVLKLATTFFAVAVVDSAGRRPLLLGGVGGIVATLFTLGYASGSSDLGLVSVGALLLYVAAYQVSFGPISWLMVAEVFPARARAKLSGLATTINFGSNALVAAVLPSVQESIGQSNTFYAFGVIGIAALAFVATVVPETKGKSLEEIEALFMEPGPDDLELSS